MKIISDPDDPILTTRAVAALLGVALSTAQQWIESGAIESWKTPGGHRRVRRSAILRLLEAQNPARAFPVAAERSAADKDEFTCMVTPDYPVADNEAKRLQSLAATGLVDTLPERVFDRLTKLACCISYTPIALVSLLTARRQWFKSRVGLAALETPREWAFCGHTILCSTPMVVPDAANDERFATNPLVTGDPRIRYYAGFPLSDRRGYRIGTLCVIDQQPRVLSQEQMHALGELAAIASEEIARRP